MAASTACKPFDAIVDTAGSLMKRAQECRRTAQRDLDDSGRFVRRQARTQLADADAQLAAADQTLESAENRARPTRETRAAARTNLAAARRNYDSHDQIARWSYLPGRVEAAEQRTDALDGWRHWAGGKSVTDSMVTCVVHGLSAETRTDDRGARGAPQTSSSDGHKPKGSTFRDRHRPSNAQASRSTSDSTEPTSANWPDPGGRWRLQHLTAQHPRSGTDARVVGNCSALRHDSSTVLRSWGISGLRDGRCVSVMPPGIARVSPLLRRQR